MRSFICGEHSGSLEMHTRVSFHEIENYQHTQQKLVELLSQFHDHLKDKCCDWHQPMTSQSTSQGSISPFHASLRKPIPKAIILSIVKASQQPAKKLPSLQDLRRLRLFPTNSTGHRSNWKYLDLSNSCVNFSFSFTMPSVTDSTMSLVVSVLSLPSQKGSDFLWSVYLNQALFLSKPDFQKVMKFGVTRLFFSRWDKVGSYLSDLY